MLFIFSFSEGTLIPTHQSGKALYYNSIKTELKSPQKNDQTKSHQAKHQQPQPQGNHQEHHAKETKVVFSNGGVNTALHDSVEPTSTENGKILASKENGKVVENGNHDKVKSENSDHTSGFHISPEHLSLEGSDRQDYKKCRELLSDRTAACLEKYFPKSIFASSIHMEVMCHTNEALCRKF